MRANPRRSNYVLGRSRENNLKYRLIRAGWLVFRMQGSAGGLPSAKIKPIDLVAIKKGHKPLFIQTSRHRSDISAAEKKELVRLASAYGADPTLAYVEGRRWVLQGLDFPSRKGATARILTGVGESCPRVR